MLINTQANVIQSLQGQYAAYYFSGTEKEYKTRASLRDAVAACTLTLARNTTQLASKTAVKLKPAPGQMTHIDGTSQIVIPSSVTFPQYDAGTNQIQAEQCLLPLQQSNLSDYWKGFATGSTTATGDILFTFASPVNLTTIQQVAANYLVGSVQVQVGGNWQSVAAAFTPTAHSVAVCVSNVTAVKITVPATYVLGGSFIFFGTEVTPSVMPTITHMALVPVAGLTPEQLALAPATYVDTVNVFAISLTAGSPLSTGTETVLNTVTPAVGQSPVPITFAIAGGVITATIS